METRQEVSWTIPVAVGLGAGIGGLVLPIMRGQPFTTTMLFGAIVIAILVTVLCKVILTALARRRSA